MADFIFPFFTTGRIQSLAITALAMLVWASDLQANEQVRQRVVQQGIAFLVSKGQSEDGSFSAAVGPAITALSATAMMKNGRTVEDPSVAKALKYLDGFQRKDGGIYAKDSLYRNYETAVIVQCLVLANHDGRYDKRIKNATQFLKGLQWDEGEGKDPTDFAFGGAGYGKHGRPDLSNTSFFVEALRAAGVEESDPALKRALGFISRCQNHESSHNRTPYAAKNPDGGFYYTPSPGQSQAGTTEAGGLRSYASMTYAGLKSMIYCGVDSKDPRFKAALDWIRKHYDLKSNPGLGQAGLYYYYHTFAKALSAMQVPTFKDSNGKDHHWRFELIAELAERQKADGSWSNAMPRWLEGDPNLVTAYALLALAHCAPSSEN